MLDLPNCKQAVEMASDNLDTPLTGWKKLRFNLHLLICKFCRRYNLQIGITQRTVKQHLDARQPPEGLDKATYKACQNAQSGAEE